MLVAGTPVTECYFLKPCKLKIQQVLQGSDFTHIALKPILVQCCVLYRNSHKPLCLPYSLSCYYYLFPLFP